MKSSLAIIIAAGAVLASACTTIDPYTREERTARAQRQAVIGAVSGAVAGLVTGDSSMERKQRALVGAGLGALAGAAVGNYMDRQELKLREELERTGVSVTRIGDNITLNMPGNVTFATDSAGLNAEFFEVLNSVGLVVNEFEQTVIEVAGHTDSTGSDAYNQSLSEQRAAAVAGYLQTRQVRGDRMITVGMGESWPVASNETAAGRQANRRVELTLVPLASA
ncbi:MAG TPA: OmpA family protein [Gammaproteobacteria bacterium]|nr:OmpA family protein [Gammaproteobacteria bacterium]